MTKGMLSPKSARKSYVGTLALSAMIAFGTDQHVAYAFQPPIIPSYPKSGSPLYNSRGSSNVMRYQPPGDLTLGSSSRKQEVEKPRGAMSTLGPFMFTLPGLLQDCKLHIGDPEVSDTDTGYTLTFNMPTDIKEDNIDISVSGRMLTVEIHIMKEETVGGGDQMSRDKPKHGGWSQRSSRTRSAAARSFTLPAGVSNEVSASWVSDDKVEIKLNKVPPGANDTTAPVTDSAAPMEDAGDISVGEKEEAWFPYSAADEYLSRLASKLAAGGGSENLPSGPEPESRQSLGSVLAELDKEFREILRPKSLDGAPRFPTEEKVATTVAKVREERARRVKAIRRKTMATDVSEKDLSYLIKVALPEGANRGNVKLAVTSDHALRVLFSTKKHGLMSKDVRLPWDARFSQISAKFAPEIEQKSYSGGVVSKEGVSGVEITVGRAAPPQPKDVKIM